MGLFQKSVLRKYLASQDVEACKAAYDLYVARFHDPHLQAQIGIMNEVEYQDGFLTHLFVNILGYTKRPDEGYNLVREKKNETDGKKADGAILRPDDSVIAVIELKGAKIKDLDKIDDQAWGYQRSHINCPYVITSNFEKLRFFIDNAVEHEEFNLFTLTQEQFSLLWLCLQKDNLQGDLPKKVKAESLLEEEKVTKRLYKDYSAFKSDLWQDMCQQNSEYDELELYKKSQKLLDRFLFIFFAEDKGLLPPNSISQIVNQWSQLKELDAYTPLYDRLKLYFGYMNNGRKAPGKEEIHAYNGGLFKTDELLDGLNIDDELLRNHCLKLSEYDFDTEVDTNILGHIFEHSLNDIENVRAELAGAEVDKSKTKRKKDGVFYTPKYITKYIVDNTVGKLCEEKKAEIGIEEEEFAKGRKGRRSDTLKKLDEQLKQYREWLLQLTICDPACGSGAFLNQTLEFLMAEHRHIDELESQLLGYAMVFQDVENHILERNIFGVDINEESVEIARLSLWLRTAQKGRTLTSLSNNIKVGNSLIDDPEVAGELAFNWQGQFPTVFEKGGFDVVIGNPPYVRADSPGNDLDFREYLVKSGRFLTLKGKWDLYIPFVELSNILSNDNGVASLIIPDAYCHADYAVLSLSYFTNNSQLRRIDYFPDVEVFENVGVQSVIVSYDKGQNSKYFLRRVHSDNQTFLEEKFRDYPKSFRVDYRESIIQNSSDLTPINNIVYISKGIVGNSDEKKYKGEFKVGDLIADQKDQLHCKLYYEGKDINKWVLTSKRWIEYGNERSPAKWSRKGFPELFSSEKIVTMRSPGNVPRCFLDKEQGFFNESAIGFVRWIDLKTSEAKSINNSVKDDTERKRFEAISEQFSLAFLLAIMNSRLVKYELNSNRRSNIHIYPDDWRKVRIPKVSPSEQHELENNVEAIIVGTTALQEISVSFLELLQSKFPIDKPSKKLQNWPDLDFKAFLSELKKKKVKLSLGEEADWLTHFNNKKTEANAIRLETDRIDKQIDQMVYELYGLSEEEIMIVEAS